MFMQRKKIGIFSKLKNKKKTPIHSNLKVKHFSVPLNATRRYFVTLNFNWTAVLELTWQHLLPVNIKQKHLFMSSAQPRQVGPFLVPPGPSLHWLGQTGWSRIPAGFLNPLRPLTPQSGHPTPGLSWRKGQLLCVSPWGVSAGLSSSHCARISAMSPSDPSEHQI